jgi:hypothetical protein
MTNGDERSTTMSKPGKWTAFAGLLLHGLIGGLMIFAGTGKLAGFFPPEALEKLGLGGQIRLIGGGELVTGLLLLIPRTSSLGVLLTGAFWGGAICIHMGHGEPYVVPSVLLLLTWLGAYLRLPAMFSSFRHTGADALQRATLPQRAPAEWTSAAGSP